ncbi:SpaA isopeptide-forming pilin-related protein [Catenisphaera adipataccumulans]|uniref:Uncharacterized protein n=1 Tax=Catenisphaera adipataccumulans TaxID=700500 RepID=A0A7W8FUW8_9FIRM|nr:hypothetical protein [Catenisphaera adipataccumulans]
MKSTMKRVSLYAFFFVCLFAGFCFVQTNAYASTNETTEGIACDVNCDTEEPPLTDENPPEDLEQPILIHKIDENGNQIKDAELELTDQDGNSTEIVTTDDATVVNLPDGEYTLHEKNAPDGYQKSDDVSFQVKPVPDPRTTDENLKTFNKGAGINSRIGAISDGEAAGVWIDTEGYGAIVYQLEMYYQPSEEAGETTYTISYMTKNNRNAYYGGDNMVADPETIDRRIAYLLNYGYKGTPFSGMSHAESYVATQIAIWAIFQEMPREAILNFTDDEIQTALNIIYPPTSDGQPLIPDLTVNTSSIRIKMSELYNDALTKADQAKYRHYVVYSSSIRGMTFYGEGFTDYISLGFVTPGHVFMLDLPEETTDTEKTNTTTTETTNDQGVYVQAAQTSRTGGVNTAASTQTAIYFMGAIVVIGAAIMMKKATE